MKERLKKLLEAYVVGGSIHSGRQLTPEQINKQVADLLFLAERAQDPDQPFPEDNKLARRVCRGFEFLADNPGYLTPRQPPVNNSVLD